MTDRKFPKPPARIRDKELLARFAATRPVCQICWLGPKIRLLLNVVPASILPTLEPRVPARVQIHHMADLPHLSRRSDVFENLMRLCADCHVVKFHSEARWSKELLRELKNEDERLYRDRYAEFEMLYDGRVLWAT